jgi:hypothetical protein
MPPYRRPTSRAQARLFGAAAGGSIPGFSPADARKKLKGVKESKLPARSKKKKGK